jgi:hypothetical protein
MAQILGSTPNRGPTRPQSCGGLPTGRSAADCRPADRWHLAGRPIRCDRRSRHQRWVFLRTCPGRRLPAPGPGHEPWTGPPKGIWAGPGITGLLGTGPRAMPLRAAPGEKLGAAACARTKRNAQPVLQTPFARPAGRLPARQRTDPHEPSQAKPWHTGRAFRASLSLIPLLLAGHTGRDDEGGEDEPEPDGS